MRGPWYYLVRALVRCGRRSAQLRTKTALIANNFSRAKLLPHNLNHELSKRSAV
jgi:hypothetical protein